MKKLLVLLLFLMSCTTKKDYLNTPPPEESEDHTIKYHQVIESQYYQISLVVIDGMKEIGKVTLNQYWEKYDNGVIIAPIDFNFVSNNKFSEYYHIYIIGTTDNMYQFSLNIQFNAELNENGTYYWFPDYIKNEKMPLTKIVNWKIKVDGTYNIINEG
jgi:hypothetical protein